MIPKRVKIGSVIKHNNQKGIVVEILDEFELIVKPYEENNLFNFFKNKTQNFNTVEKWQWYCFGILCEVVKE